MNMKDRFKRGFAISIAVHFLVIIVLALCGMHFVTEAQPAVIEVAVFEPMGGHAGGGQQSKATEAKQVEEPEQQQEEQKDELVDEALEPKEPPPKVEQTPTPPQNTNENKAATKGEGSGEGEGTGTGDGHGYGNGSGDGTGTGDGSGSGNSPAVPPRILRHVEPKYPKAARNNSIEGTVRIRILISTDGEVDTVDIVSSSGDDSLDNAAVVAAEQWLFEPAQNSFGQSIRCYTEIPIMFELN